MILQQFGHYRITAKIGEGGMGVVYRALDTNLNRPVAIKFLSDALVDAAERRRFQREAQMASSLNHPHILTVHDVGEFEGRQYIVTEFMDGGTLREWSKAEKRSWRQIVDLLIGVADGLAAAHTAGILHRDIKPANILVARNGYAKLADFGLAKLSEAVEGSTEDATHAHSQGLTRSGISVVASPRGRTWLSAGVVIALAATAAVGWLRRDPVAVFENPLANAKFTRLTDFAGTEIDAAISPDGKFVAYLADRNGQFDVWLSQVGAGSPINLTPGPEDDRAPLRSVGFSGDGSEVWLPGVEGRKPRLIPLVGGAPRVFLGENAVHPAWSPDGTRIAYHTLEAGDPLYVADRNGANARRIFIGRPDQHNHFPVWSRDGKWIYFVHGTPASNEMDLWRIPSAGGKPERLTEHNNDVRDPTPLGASHILYVARENNGAGPWLWVYDIQLKRSHRVTHGLELYTSVGASADGRRLAATVANPIVGLWSVPIFDRLAEESDVKPFVLPNVRAFAPRWRRATLYYLSSHGTGDGLWRYQDGLPTEIWKGAEGALFEPPAISPDGKRIAILLRRQGKRGLHVISADGGEARALASDIDVQGSSSWSPDGEWIVTGGADEKGPGLFKIPTAGGTAVRLTDQLGRNPVWSPDGSLIAYAGPNDAFNQAPLLALRPDGTPVDLPAIRVHRDGERIRFTPDGKGLIYMQAATPWQDFWLLDLATLKARQLTRLNNPATMRTFDITADGKQIVFDRLRENSDVVVIDLVGSGE